MLLFILVNPITRISDGETFFQDNSETLITLSSQSSKILADFQGEDKMDTQKSLMILAFSIAFHNYQK